MKTIRAGGFGVTMGALAASIDGQLLGQGFMLTRYHAKQFQRQADAISLLYIHGLLTDSEADKARNRLVKAIGFVAKKGTP